MRRALGWCCGTVLVAGAVAAASTGGDRPVNVTTRLGEEGRRGPEPAPLVQDGAVDGPVLPERSATGPDERSSSSTAGPAQERVAGPPAPRVTTTVPDLAPTTGPAAPVPTTPALPATAERSTTTTQAPRPASEVFRRHGYWIGDADRQTARWLMPIVNSGDSWSPDGTRIVYRSASSGISIIDVRTGETRALIEDSGGRSFDAPSWSPDGLHVALHETRFGQPPALLVVDLQGQEVARYPDWVDGQQGHAWSPDGTRIAFASYDAEEGKAWLSVATLGAAPTKVADADGDHRFLGLHWSPRGTYLGWTYDEDLHLMHLVTKLVSSFDLDGTPIYGHAWSPDEARVVVWSTRLFTMRPDGLQRTVIDPLGHNASVDPTTGRIAWTSGYGAGQERVVVSAPDGSDQRTVLTTAADAAVDGVTWSPAGGTFLFIEYG
jgi:dipeptidyl aminopeptidase/acylaminoacyl peptidase